MRANSDGGVTARLVLEVEDCPAQRVSIKFKLVSGFDPYPASLQATFNPTTIFTGNNVHPVTVADPETGEIRPFPSSDPQVMARINRLGFDLLEQLNQQATKTRALLFHPNTRALIQRGDVHLMRAQWCAYLPTPDVPSFLQTVGLMYDHAIAEGKGIVRVARHLGLSFKYYPEAADACDTTGVMLIKSHGKKPLFSLVFYDKRQRVADMKQGKSLSAAGDRDDSGQRPLRHHPAFRRHRRPGRRGAKVPPEAHCSPPVLRSGLARAVPRRRSQAEPLVPRTRGVHPVFPDSQRGAGAAVVLGVAGPVYDQGRAAPRRPWQL